MPSRNAKDCVEPAIAPSEEPRSATDGPMSSPGRLANIHILSRMELGRNAPEGLARDR